MNDWLGAGVAAFFLLGTSACHTTHKEQKPSKGKAASVEIRQTGSNLTHRYELSEPDDSEKKSKSKKDKKIDKDYLPRGGFR